MCYEAKQFNLLLLLVSLSVQMLFAKTQSLGFTA